MRISIKKRMGIGLVAVLMLLVTLGMAQQLPGISHQSMLKQVEKLTYEYETALLTSQCGYHCG